MVPATHKKSCALIFVSLSPLPFNFLSSLTLTLLPVLALASLRTPKNLTPLTNSPSLVHRSFSLALKRQSTSSQLSNHISQSNLAVSLGSVPPFNEIVPRVFSALQTKHNAPNNRLSSKPPSSPLSKTMVPKTSPTPLHPLHRVSSLSNRLYSPVSASSSGLLAKLLPSSPFRHTVSPLFENQPFTVTWNIPVLVCNRLNITLDTLSFKGVATPAKVRRYSTL